MKDWIVAKGIQLLEHPPYSPDLALANFFLRVKEILLVERIEKCGRIGSDFIEKS